MPLDDATYTTVLERVAKGELVTDVCADLAVSRQMVWRKSEESPESADAYTRARVAQAHSLAEDTVITSRKALGLNSDGVAAKRLEVDTLKWFVTKIAPRLYGDRLDVQALVQHTVSGVIALPEEDVPLPRASVTARLASSSDTLGDATQPVDAPTVTRQRAPVAGEGVGGGDGTGTGGVAATPTA